MINETFLREKKITMYVYIESRGIKIFKFQWGGCDNALNVKNKNAWNIWYFKIYIHTCMLLLIYTCRVRVIVILHQFQQYFNYCNMFVWLFDEFNATEKTTDMSQVTDKLYHIMLYTSPWSRFDSQHQIWYALIA
jgi:hypothetical protein